MIARNTSPYFSIIIPTYNRAGMIGRAIESCFNQDYTDFEIIVIDDGSTDNTIERVNTYQDSRIMLLEHKLNRGVCAARNTGIAKARGQWLIMLDSDFELLPDALKVLVQRTAAAADDIGNIASSCQFDTGIITPFPNVPNGPIGYKEFLAWTDSLKISEWFNCFRKEVFSSLLYPEERAYEASFNLDFIKSWKIEVSREPAVIFHTDAKNRITASPPDQLMCQLLRDAADCSIDSERILLKHGIAMQEWSPRSYNERLNLTATYFYLSNQRQKGFGYSKQALKKAPLNLRCWGTLFLGFLGAVTFAWVKAYWNELRYIRVNNVT